MIKDKYKLSIAKFAYKQQNKKLPDIFDNYYSKIKEKHCHEIRNNEDLIIPKCKTEIAKRSSIQAGAREWNNLPIKIRQSKTLAKKSKEFLINKY